MNILLINHYAGSLEYGMEYRPYYLAREWVKLGHNVTIVGANFSHLRIKQPQAGEESEEAVQREIKEETGLDVSGADGGYMFTYHRENPGEGDNYFVDVYRYIIDFDESDLHLQEAETDGYKFATLDEIKEFAKQGIFLHYDSIKEAFEV